MLKTTPTKTVHMTEEIDNELCEQVELVLMTEELDKHQIFVAEASKSAVLDTACTKTVAGVTWFNNFVETLTPQRLAQMEILTSNTSFKFGDGRKSNGNEESHHSCHHCIKGLQDRG